MTVLAVIKDNDVQRQNHLCVYVAIVTVTTGLSCVSYIMDAKSIERVVRGAVSDVLTRIVNERQTSGVANTNGDTSESSELEDNQRQPPATQVSKKRCAYTQVI